MYFFKIRKLVKNSVTVLQVCRDNYDKHYYYTVHIRPSGLYLIRIKLELLIV